MPFDSTTFCQPTVTVLSPQPPERGGGPQRIQLLIEIVRDRSRRSDAAPGRMASSGFAGPGSRAGRRFTECGR